MTSQFQGDFIKRVGAVPFLVRVPEGPFFWLAVQVEDLLNGIDDVFQLFAAELLGCLHSNLEFQF